MTLEYEALREDDLGNEQQQQQRIRFHHHQDDHQSHHSVVLPAPKPKPPRVISFRGLCVFKVYDKVDATWKAIARGLKLFLLGLFLQGGYMHGCFIDIWSGHRQDEVDGYLAEDIYCIYDNCIF